MKEIQNLEQLKEHQKELEESLDNFKTPFSFGIGLATKSSADNIMDVFIPWKKIN